MAERAAALQTVPDLAPACCRALDLAPGATRADLRRALGRILRRYRRDPVQTGGALKAYRYLRDRAVTS
jgi:hypothetical protein